MSSLTLKIEGLRCAGCVAVLENSLRQCTGVQAVSVNLVSDRAWVVLDAHADPLQAQQAIIQRVKEAGFGAEVLARPELSLNSTVPHPKLWLSLLLLGMGGLGHLVPYVHHSWWYGWSALILLMVCGYRLWWDGVTNLVQGHPNMQSLVTLGMGGSIIHCFLSQHGVWSETLLLLGFVRFGEWLLAHAKTRSHRTLTSLLQCQSATARKLTPTGTVLIPTEAIAVGDELQVLAGETIPTDGTVIKGHSLVNEAMLTGESLPIPKQVGMQVIGGTVNLEQSLVIKAERVGADTTWAKLIKLVEQGQMSKAPVQQLADQVSAYFAWGIMGIALLTWGVWTWQADWVHALRMAVSLLVVACPCALGLAVPTAIAVGTGLAAQRGIVIKSVEHLERIAHLDTIILDKTGTLTLGQPVITDVVAIANLTPRELLHVAASAEQHSNHPLAKGLKRAVPDLPLLPITHSALQVGGGITATLHDGRTVQVGSPNWLAMPLRPEETQQLYTWQKAGKTTILVAIDGQLAGMIALGDQIKPDAMATITKLKEMGYTVGMITGDRAPTAQAIASQVGIDQVWAEVTPAGKADIIRNLQAQGRQVAMVGDGINDAPALAQAQVGIAVGSGLDIALETADIILMARGELTALVDALQLGQATFRKIYQNLGWAFIYNLLAVPIAAGVLSGWGLTFSPALSALAMTGSSVSVVLNSLALVGVPPRSLGKYSPAK